MKEKERIKKILSDREYNTISQFVRKAISEKLKIEELKSQAEEVEAPDWVPDGKYYAVIKGAIIGVADSPSSLMEDLIGKFPFKGIVIKRKNKKIPKLEYAFSANSVELNCWDYHRVDANTYPIIPVKLVKKDIKKTIAVIPDTAASVCLLRSDIFDEFKLEEIDEKTVQTVSGIEKKSVFKLNLEIFGQVLQVGCISTPISKILPFQGMIGRNVLDIFDLYLLGRRKIICMK